MSKVKINGYILGDDISNVGVKLAVDEFIKKQGSNINVIFLNNNSQFALQRLK